MYTFTSYNLLPYSVPIRIGLISVQFWCTSCIRFLRTTVRLSRLLEYNQITTSTCEFNFNLFVAQIDLTFVGATSWLPGGWRSVVTLSLVHWHIRDRISRRARSLSITESMRDVLIQGWFLLRIMLCIMLCAMTQTECSLLKDHCPTQFPIQTERWSYIPAAYVQVAVLANGDVFTASVNIHWISYGCTLVTVNLKSIGLVKVQSQMKQRYCPAS